MNVSRFVFVSIVVVMILGRVPTLQRITAEDSVRREIDGDTGINDRSNDAVLENHFALFPPPTISKETTFATEPVDDDGYIDYFAVLNGKASEGVTSENNAAVLFARAGIGPSSYQSPQREQYCEMIGIDPSDVAETQVPVWKPANSRDQDDLQKSMVEPWSAERFPEVADWIESNSEPLELIVEGTKRPFCYVPLLASLEEPGQYGKLLEALLPVQQTCREVARCLAARAMLHLHQGDLQAAQQDLIACHRLGRLIGGTPHLICGLVGCAIDSVAYHGDLAVLKYATLNSDNARAYLKQLKELPPLPVMSDKLNWAERMNLLDALTTMERNLSDRLAANDGDIDDERISNLPILYDEVLKVCNERFDQFVQAQRLPTFSTRSKATAALIEQLRKQLPTGYDLKDAAMTMEFQAKTIKYLKGQSPEKAGRAIGSIQMALLFPNFQQSAEAEVRTRVREAMIQLGFAIAAYRADHSKYPETLEVLVPKDIPTLPIDLFVDRPLKYRRDDSGYCLYSVGKDGIDHKNQSINSSSKGDDLILQISDKGK